MRGFTVIVLIGLWSVLNLNAQSQLSFTQNKLISEDEQIEAPSLEKHKIVVAGKKMPFELVGGLIFLEAELGESCDQYILDTGAPTLILNSKNYNNSKNTKYVAGFSGNVPIVAKQVKGFRFGGIHKKSMLAYYTDMSHLELVKKRPVKGLIGLEAFQNKELLFDYKHQEIVVLPHKRSVKELGGFREVQRIKFRKQDHIPVIRIKIGNKTFHFGIDTGAEVNLFSKRLMKKINKENLKLTNVKRSIRGIGKNSETAISAIIKKMSIKDRDFHDMEFVFADLSHINQSYEMSLDGILGYPFLSSEIFSINFRKNKLYIWEEIIVEEPTIPSQLVSSELTE